MGSKVLAKNVNRAHQVFTNGKWHKVLYVRHIALKPGNVVIGHLPRGRMEVGATSLVDVRWARR